MISSILKSECNVKWKFKQNHYCPLDHINRTARFGDPDVNFTTEEEIEYSLSARVKNKTINNAFFAFEINVFTIPSATVSSLLPRDTTTLSNFETVTLLTSRDTTRLYSVLGFNNVTRDSIIENLEVQITLKENASNAQQKVRDLLQARKHEGKQVFVNQTSLKCVFINTTTEMLSDYGCQSSSSQNLSKISCVCSHTTVFTIVLSVSLKTVPDGVKVSKIKENA